MHFVDCGQAPASLQRLVKTNPSGQPVWDPDPKDYSEFIRDLGGRFHGNCAYCERGCERPIRESSPGDRGPASNEIDHFRPREHFRDLTFEWENLMYVCRRCNDAKGNQFPGKTNPDNIDVLRFDALRNGKQLVDLLEDDGYVNPRDSDETAESFFVFDNEGQISPNNDLDDLRWSKARRTILDFDLNPVGGPRARDLCRLRIEQFRLVCQTLPALRSRLGNDALQRLPFSSFISWAESAQSG